MFNIIICMFSNLFRISIIRRFMYVFIEKVKVRKPIEIVAYSLFFLINTGLYLGFHNPIINFMCNLIGIMLITFMYTNQWYENLFLTVTIYILNMICDIVVTFIFVDYKIGKEFNQIYFLISVMMLLICELVIENVLKYKRKTIGIKGIPLVIIPLLSICIFWILLFSRFTLELKLILISLAIFIINFLNFNFYNIHFDALKRQYDNQILKRKLDIYGNQIEVILESEKKLKNIRHDMKHHINEIKILCMQAKKTELLKYLNEMTYFIEDSKQIVSSGNADVDSLLNYMLKNAKDVLKEVNVICKLPEHMHHSFDINIILGNLLENAIEASKKSEEKKLNLNISYSKGILSIFISNSYNGEIKENEKGLLTTKQKKNEHGIGLKSVNQIVEKYNGIMSTLYNENMFQVKLLLYISQNQ